MHTFQRIINYNVMVKELEKSCILVYCLPCEAEMRHMNCCSGVVVVVVSGNDGGINLLSSFCI